MPYQVVHQLKSALLFASPLPGERADPMEVFLSDPFSPGTLRKAQATSNLTIGLQKKDDFGLIRCMERLGTTHVVRVSELC